MAARSKRKKKAVLYKGRVSVLDSLALQAVCSCGWKGNALAQSSGANAAIIAAMKELEDHTHIKEKV